MNKNCGTSQEVYTTYWRRTGPAAIQLYRSVQRVYENSVDFRVFNAEWWITMSIIVNRTPSVQGAMLLPIMRTQPVGDIQGQPSWSITAHTVYKSSVGGRVFNPEWYISMRVVPSRKPSVQGTTGLSRVCTKAVGDVPDPPPRCCVHPQK